MNGQIDPSYTLAGLLITFCSNSVFGAKNTVDSCKSFLFFNLSSHAFSFFFLGGGDIFSGAISFLSEILQKKHRQMDTYTDRENSCYFYYTD